MFVFVFGPHISTGLAGVWCTVRALGSARMGDVWAREGGLIIIANKAVLACQGACLGGGGAASEVFR